MPATVVIGAQWGDEGKGKVANLLARDADVIVRYQGGNNAGHTIVIGEEKFALSLVPSGVLYPTVTPVIGNGCVVDPKVLLAEMETLRGRGVDPDNLRLSGNAHLIMPYHRKLDAVKERFLGNNQIGTTKKGIGPAYTDKHSRQGIRVQDLFDPGILASKLEISLREKNQILTRIYNTLPMELEPIVEEYLAYAEQLAPYVTDTSLLVWQAIRNDEKVIFEGAQGVMLDVDHGTYPFVTSSSTISGGATAGAGVGPRDIDSVLGIAKAYITRVGTGPFPTELDDEVGARMVEIGGEFGTVTGRRRRCGWLDMVALRYAIRVGGITELAIMKADVLSGFPTIRIATSYEFEGERFDEFPRQQRVLYGCTPVYEDHEGWEEDITGARSMDDLPATARRYIERIEELAGVPVSMVSVGPDREATFIPS